jgi:hypothetical protein
LSSDDRDFVLEHTPISVDFDPNKMDVWLEEQPDWVLKAAFGRMGDSVVLGALCTPTQWQTALKDAAQRPQDFLMQERFLVNPLDFANGPMYPALGAFLVNGKFAGYYSRAADTPFLTHEAYHVATLIETV